MNSPVARSRRALAVGVLALLGGLSVTACRSEPSAQRVALDMVQTLENVSESERQCMTDKIEAMDGDRLAEIGDQLDDEENAFDFSQRQANDGEYADQLNDFINDLQTCHEG